MPFYLLQCAHQELRPEEVQFYWEGADRSNIESIVREEARRWLSDHKRAA